MSYITNTFDGRVVELLRGGGVGLLPSDTIYGLSCRALDQTAVERVHQLKGRDAGKPLIVLISDLKMLDLLAPSAVEGLSSDLLDLLNKCWPGSISIILPMPSSPSWLHRGKNSLAIRLPDYPQLLELINKVGPLISTSANFQGGNPALTLEAARRTFGDKLDFYVDAGELNNPPSTLAVVENGRLKVVRQGAVRIE